MSSYDVTHVLLTIILVLTAIVGVGLIVLITLVITTLLEVFALVKSVSKEISTISTALHAIGEGIADRVGTGFGILNYFKPKTVTKVAPKKKKVVKKKA